VRLHACTKAHTHLHLHGAEIINKRGRDNVTTDDIVRAIKPQVRAVGGIRYE